MRQERMGQEVEGGGLYETGDDELRGAGLCDTGEGGHADQRFISSIVGALGSKSTM